MTKWNDFMQEIVEEARREGKKAMDQLERFREFWRKEVAKIEEQPCLLERFFREQEKLPPSMRSAGALLYCPCRRCNPASL